MTNPRLKVKTNKRLKMLIGKLLYVRRYQGKSSKLYRRLSLVQIMTPSVTNRLVA